MYLKSIEVHGFKSFANKILFEFHDGITGIVGPNGSGKSNVADAVRWVLGEQSAKQLRGSNMQDVIFSGTETRKPLGFAYVAITLDNLDHKLPVEYDEVTVVRRVYRSGESEYRINGNSCRLRDVQDLFLDTGIGKEGYSIIGQGQIDKILSGKPEERRELFDEAAGIVKFKKRKAIAEKNLEEERLNLSRISDILLEIEKQLAPLEKQSEVAKEYLKYKQELKCLEIDQFLEDHKTDYNLKEQIQEKQKIAEEDLGTAKKEYESTKEIYDKTQNEMESHSQKLDLQKSERGNLELELEKRDGTVKVLEEQIAALDKEEAFSQERLLKIKSDISEKQLESEKYLLKKREMDEKLDLLDDQQSASVTGLLMMKESIAEDTRKMEACKNEIFRILNENSTIKGNIQRYDTIHEQNNIKRAEFNQYLLKNKSEEAVYVSNVNESHTILEEARQKMQLQSTENTVLEQRIEVVQKRLEEIGLEFTKRQQESMEVSSKLESLKNLTERYEGYGNSIRRVMEQKERQPGIVGVVADIITVEKNYEVAVEIALGGSIQNIVTEEEETAKLLIEFLKKNKYGRATFLPLTSMSLNKGKYNEKVLSEDGVVGTASSLVSVAPKFSVVVENLLGRIYVVDTIDHAILLNKRYQHTLRIVTLEGEQLMPGGSISGGAYKNTSNLLSRRREMEELESISSEKKQALERLSEEREQLRKSRTAYREQLEQGKQKIQLLSVEQNTAELRLAQEKEKILELNKSFHRYTAEIRELDQQAVELKDSLNKLRDNLKENLDYNKQQENKIEEYSQEVEKKKISEKRAEEQTALLRIELSNLEQSSQYEMENIKRTKRELGRFQEEELQLIRGKEDFSKHREEKRKLIDLEMQQKQKLSLLLLESDQAIRLLSERIEELTKNNKDFFKKREELSERMQLLDKEVFRLLNQKEKLCEKIDQSITYMWEEYELTFTAAANYQYNIPTDRLQNKKNISAMKAKIRLLGDVNVNAIEDFKNLSERFEFLRTQKEDLQEAEKTLVQIICELDIEMRRQFEEKFNLICRQFDIVFKELFGGGKGTLELTEEQDILEAGIRIIAQPPGKKLQNMMQLSGGEKALTAIALLFSIQNLKPSPFCLLDEIEAALDDSNVTRYAKYLHKLTKDTQFIIITHRRGTMAAADILYGITMQEKGVSTLVSVNLIEGELDK